MALSMQREIAAIETGGPETFRVQIGVHSGSAIAGVVGINKLAYDLWGPTVNLASQIESNGLAGNIQVSSATHSLLKDRYLLEPRGEFYVKGQGEISTYLLRGRGAG
jgi:class 3 adenylate cyclase